MNVYERRLVVARHCDFDRHVIACTDEKRTSFRGFSHQHKIPRLTIDRNSKFETDNYLSIKSAIAQSLSSSRCYEFNRSFNSGFFQHS